MISGLEVILKDIEDGVLRDFDRYEDIHSFVEATLIEAGSEPVRSCIAYKEQK